MCMCVCCADAGWSMSVCMCVCRVLDVRCSLCSFVSTCAFFEAHAKEPKRDQTERRPLPSPFIIHGINLPSSLPPILTNGFTLRDTITCLRLCDKNCQQDIRAGASQRSPVATDTMQAVHESWKGLGTRHVIGVGVVVKEHRRKIPRWSRWGRSTFY